MRLFSARDELSRAIPEAGLRQRHDRIMASARPTVRYVAYSARSGSGPTGASRMGGPPDLPATLNWPVRPAYPDAETRNAEIRYHCATRLRSLDYQLQNDRRNQLIAVGAALPFIAQIDLAGAWLVQQLEIDLPRHGRLLFYDARETPPGFDPSDGVGFRVVWDETPASAIVAAAPPPELVVDGLVFVPRSLTPTPGFVLPEWETFGYERIGLPQGELGGHL